jgi:hypothetical protein
MALQAGMEPGVERSSIRLRYDSMKSLRLTRVADVFFALLVFALLFAMHSRWVFSHFSSDAYLEDSGWLAYLFESADPLLHNPSGVNDLSFYAHHLSPHIFLFGAPLSTLFGLTGIEIFAYHQGFFFGLFFLSFYLLAARSGLRRHDRIAAIVFAVLLGAVSNALFQAAAYPHDEIAMIAIASLAMAAWLAGYRRLFILCLLWLPLVREDGGFYAAVACLACVAVTLERRRPMDPSIRLLMVLAIFGVIASASSFIIKAWFFPGFNAFANNFSGQWWNHVTPAFAWERVRAMLYNWNILPVLMGCVALAVFDIRYLTGLVLLAPVYLLHLLAIRPEHGYFTLYFALPWLLPCAIWLAVFVKRSTVSPAAFAEMAVILAVALALSAPVQAAAGAPGQFWFVAMWAFQRPVEDTREMQEFVRWARRSLPAPDPRRPNESKQCVSQGIAALIPNEVRPADVLAPRDGLRACHVLFLMRGDMHYADLSTRAQAAGFERMGSKRNAELWLVAK